MFRKLLCVFLFCVSASGCFWSSREVRPSSGPVNNLSVEILRADLLAQGGVVMVLPFKAGPGAEATPALDRIALSIVKGAADTFSRESSRLVYKVPDSAAEADFVLEGHIDQFQTSGWGDRMLLKNKALIQIKGDLRKIRSQEVVALIYDQRETINDAKSLQLTTYSMGVDIARELIK